MQQHIILGYSESVLSFLLETLQLAYGAQKVTILQNIGSESKGEIPFIPNGMEICLVSPGMEFELPSKGQFNFGVFLPSVKKILFSYAENKFEISPDHFLTLTHPSASVSSSSDIGKGTYIGPLSVISPYSKLGFGVSVNRMVSIGHHTQIGAFSSIAPGSHIGGHAIINSHVQIGIGATVFDHIQIGQNSIIGGGSVVTRDIPAGVLAWGNPCKVIRPVAKE